MNQEWGYETHYNQAEEELELALNEWQPEAEFSPEIPRQQYSPANRRPNPGYGGQNPSYPMQQPCGTSLGDFKLNSDIVPEKHYDTIWKIAQTILANQSSRAPVRAVRITGHTDQSGGYAYNQNLGQRRAENIKKLLIQALEQQRPGSSSQVRILSGSQGEALATAQYQPASRRVEICLIRVPRPVRPPYQPPFQPPHVCKCPKCGGGGGANMQCFWAVQRTIFMAIRNLKAVAAACRRQSHGCQGGSCGHRR